MSNLKVGDKVRRLNYRHDNLRVGDEGIVASVRGEIVTIVGGDPECTHQIGNLELVNVSPPIPSPVVTETVTRIEPGVYGRLAISKQAGTDTRRILVNLADETGYCGTTSHGWSFDELCAAIEVLTAVKTHLEDQKP